MAEEVEEGTGNEVPEEPARAELVRQGDIAGPPGMEEFEAIRNQAALLARTELVPEAFRKKPDDIVVVILTGRELAIPPMRALQEIHVIDGKPGLSATLMMALVRRAGHEIWIPEEEATAESATCYGKRKGSDRIERFTFTMADAKQARLYDRKGDMYKKYPKAMLAARATSGLCRRVFSDVVMFGYTPEELEAADDPGIEMARTPLLPPADPNKPLEGVHPEWIERELAHHSVQDILDAALPYWKADRKLESLHDLHEVPLDVKIGIAGALKKLRGEPEQEKVEHEPAPEEAIADPIKGGCSDHPNAAEPDCAECQWILDHNATMTPEEAEQQALLGVPGGESE